MGPVLPYDKSSVKIIEIKNPMSFPIEVYSADFDKKYIEEEEILKRYEFETDVIFEKLRKAGDEFWPEIRQADEKRMQLESMQQRIKDIEQSLENDFNVPEPEDGQEAEPLPEEKVEEKAKLEAEKTDIEQKLNEIEAEKLVVKKVPRKVKERDRVNVILFGPEKCGKSTIAYFLNEEQERGIVNLNELLSWSEKNNSPSYEEISKYLEERDEECKVQEELEKKKKKKKEGEEEFDPLIYKHLPKEMLIKLLRERTSAED